MDGGDAQPCLFRDAHQPRGQSQAGAPRCRQRSWPRQDWLLGNSHANAQREWARLMSSSKLMVRISVMQPPAQPHQPAPPVPHCPRHSNDASENRRGWGRTRRKPSLSLPAMHAVRREHASCDEPRGCISAGRACSREIDMAGGHAAAIGRCPGLSKGVRSRLGAALGTQTNGQPTTTTATAILLLLWDAGSDRATP